MLQQATLENSFSTEAADSGRLSYGISVRFAADAPQAIRPQLAALGAIGGDAGLGAATGVTGGAVSGGTTMARDSNADFKRIFTNCLHERGHPVLN